jgi:hypothetical protein
MRALLVLLLLAAPAWALDPGATVGADRAADLGDLVLPGTLEAVKRGMRVEVAEGRPVHWRRAYTEATEKYASQVRLGPAGELLNYTAGLPFPNVGAEDERAALKVMWNHAFGPWISDDAQSWSIEWQLGNVKPGKPMEVVSQERNDIEHSKWISFIGRTEVPPIPAVTDNADRARGAELFGPTLPVFLTMLRSGPMLTLRYLDLKEDDSWYWVSWNRKSLRLPPQIRYDGTGGVVMDLNSMWGFNAPVGSYTFKLLGERKMLGVLHARHYPAEWCPEGGDFAPCDAWEERAVYVVEATAEKPYDIYGKRVVALDKQAWVVLASDLYDKKGKLWKTLVNHWSYRPDKTGRQEWPYLLSGFVIDFEESQANRWRLPGTRPLAEAVAINTGLGRELFTVDAMPKAFHDAGESAPVVPGRQ